MKFPTFKNVSELQAYLVKNQKEIIAEKKSQIKYEAGCIIGLPEFVYEKDDTVKAEATTEDLLNRDEIKVKVIINTTNLLDSHNDVHLPGLWNDSLKENTNINHLQEHVSRFSHIIAGSDDVKAFVKNFTWSELGFPFTGKTQALVFESTVKKSRNLMMFEHYIKGWIKQHSVGMRYVNILLAVNNEKFTAEFEAWKKYLKVIANNEAAEDQGFFWVVKKADIIEGSAVVVGSNFATPTIEIKFAPEKQAIKEIENKEINYSNIEINI